MLLPTLVAWMRPRFLTRYEETRPEVEEPGARAVS
jgi:hypothetical protein